MTPFTFNTTPSISFGAGALGNLGALAKARIPGRALIVTDPGIV